jgi:hypothetical protein
LLTPEQDVSNFIYPILIFSSVSSAESIVPLPSASSKPKMALFAMARRLQSVVKLLLTPSTVYVPELLKKGPSHDVESPHLGLDAADPDAQVQGLV